MSINKFKPVFEPGRIKHQSKPYTQILNKPIQEITNLAVIGLWTYFQTLPENWHINPVHVQKHFRVGKDKVHNLFVQLIESNLLIKNVVRNENGTFNSIDYIVCNGENFKPINIQKSQVVQPFPDYPEPAEPEPVNPPLINKTINTNKNNKEKLNISCASDDARSNYFDDFWKTYPVKKNKKRSKQIWDKKKYNEIASIILLDLDKRKRLDHQWQDIQFIPHPSTYLSNELWQDDIVKAAPIQQQKPKPNEPRCTVKEFGPGHPTWEADQEWRRKHDSHGSEASRNNTGGNGVRQAKDYLLS